MEFYAVSVVHKERGFEDGQWFKWEQTRIELSGGSGSAARPVQVEIGPYRLDKHLPQITALIDERQFEIISQPEAGVILIQGGAGSGKTTVALHRLAYLDDTKSQTTSTAIASYRLFSTGPFCPVHQQAATFTRG